MRAGARPRPGSTTATSRSSSSTRSASASSTASTASIDAPTDVLSFGVDEDGDSAGPRELGDIVICPPHTEDLREAVVHGALHLTGMDHETDDGEMLALQAELMRWVAAERRRRRRRRAPASSRSPAGPTSASRRWPTRSSAPRWRSSPTSRRPPGARSAASPPAPTGSSCSSTCPASSARATRSPSACSAASSASWPTPTAACSWSTPSRASARATASSPGCCAGAAVPVVDRGQQGRPRRAGPDRGHPARRRRRSSVADEIFPVWARTGAGVPAAGRAPRRAAARGPVLLRGRAALRPGAESVLLAELVREQVLRAHPRGGSARGRGRGRGDRRSPRDDLSGSRPSSWPRPSPRRGS